MTETTGMQVAEESAIIEEMVQNDLSVTEQRASDFHDKIQEIQSGSIQTLLQKQNELVARVEALAELENFEEQERQAAILQADLASVRAELAKRTQNVGVLATELFALYDTLGLQSQKAQEDSPEDIKKREDAEAAITDAQEALAIAKANLNALEEALTTFEKEKTKAEGSFFIGRKGRVAEADQKLRSHKKKILDAQSAIGTKETGLETAENALPEILEQIEVDKADRVRKASLSENFALIRKLTKMATDVLTEDITNTDKRIDQTEKGLNSAVKRKTEVTRDHDAVLDQITKLERDLDREQAALNEIPDQGSTAYSEQHEVVIGIEKELTEKSGRELELNSKKMALTRTVTVFQSSLKGLQMQSDTATVYRIKLETAEKTAAVLGRNIDQMIKNTTQEAASDALDQVTDKMMETAVSLGVQAEVASNKTRNDALERHHKAMENISHIRKTGDQATAEEAERYIKIDAAIRKGYKDLGVDIDMGNLAKAAEMSMSESVGAETEDEVTF